MNLRAPGLAFLLVSLGALPAQLIPKNLETKRPDVPTRPAGVWVGKAQEPLEDGRTLDYDLTMQFDGADDALRLEVRATVPVDTGQGRVTVSVRATYRGSFRQTDLRMQSEAIEVRVVETGERMPSVAQTVEARLVDGVLRGRVGSDGEGWTTFTARSAEPGKAAAAAPLRGRWSGSATERGPDGRELCYPVRVEFRGNGDSMLAEVAADLRYPTQDGSTPVEYRATFRGTHRGDELRLSSEKVTIKLVETGRTEDGPRQELTGTVRDGVLTARIGGGDGDDTTLELRPDGGGDTVGERTTTDPQPSPNPGFEPERKPGSNTGRRELPASYRTVLLERRDVRDAGAGNVVSHTMRVPRGWDLRAGPQWRANPDSFVTFVGEVSGREGEAITFVADHVFNYNGTQSTFGSQSSETQAWTREGSATRRPPSGPGAVAVELLVPFLRPGASDVQLVDAGRLEQREVTFRAACANTIEAFETAARSMAMNSNVQSNARSWLACERSRVRYREGGRVFEEEFECSLLGMHYTSQIEGFATDNGVWTVCGVRSFRAPAGELDARLPILVVVADSVREDPRWALGVAEIRLELAKARTQQLRMQTAEMQRRIADRAAANHAMSDADLASWRRQQEANDRMHEANVQSLTETQKFRDGEGTTYTVTNHYDRAFRNPDDTILLTNDPNYRPAGDPAVNQVQWEEMQRIDPFGQGR